MKLDNLLSLALIFLVVLLFSSTIYAHPGRTASDGCHYCRTNCAKWGEVSGARHCHGGYTAPAQEYVAPTNTPKPFRTGTPTKKPAKKPTPSVTKTTSQQVSASFSDQQADEASYGGLFGWLLNIFFNNE